MLSWTQVCLQLVEVVFLPTVLFCALQWSTSPLDFPTICTAYASIYAFPSLRSHQWVRTKHSWHQCWAAVPRSCRIHNSLQVTLGNVLIGPAPYTLTLSVMCSKHTWSTHVGPLWTAELSHSRMAV